MPCRRPEDRTGEGAISTSFWLRRWSVQSRSKRWVISARAVAEHLDFDVARPADEPLDVDVAVPERGRRLGLAAGVGGVEVFEALDGADAAAAAAGDSFDHHRGAFAQRAEEGFDVVQGRRATKRRRMMGTPALTASSRARALSPKSSSVFGLRTDEREPGLDAGLRERRVLAEEAVPGMDRVAVGFLRRFHQLRDVEVGGGALPGELHGGIAAARVERRGVVLREDDGGADAEFGCGPADADGDLAAIRDE